MQTLISELWLPTPREKVFHFFADAANLQEITPDWLSFHVMTPQPITMAVGTRIQYRLKIHGFPVGWESEITVWGPPYRFVDEQQRGPYRSWIHEHTFTEKDGGTLVTDRVQYSVWGGFLIDRLLVRRDVKRIFDYRTGRLRSLFHPDSFGPRE